MTNALLLDHLFTVDSIGIRRSGIFDTAPSSLPPSFCFDRVEGVMLGIAIGDGLGITSEGMLPSSRRERYGELRDYLPNKHTGERRGYPSDDTQLAFWTLDCLLEDDGFIPDHVAAAFCRERVFGIGSAVEGFRQRYRSGVRPWYGCSVKSAGNGALMRIAPILIPHLRKPSVDVWVDTALCAMITHNDSASIASCVAFVAMLWDLLYMSVAPEPIWWMDRFVQVAADLELNAMYRPRGGAFCDYEGTLSGFLQTRLADAWSRRLSTLDACNSWHSGAYLLETVPSVLYILMCHAHDPVEAIVRAINDTKDNDTIAAIVGAAVGALHGKSALPERWVTNLTGRTGIDDDGRAFQLLDDARKRWWDRS